MDTLPDIMLAPNGARLTRVDHHILPLTIAEIVETAIRCQAAGADGIHAHVRDKNQRHILDAGRYRELIREIHVQLPGFSIQVTTESAGLYSSQQQRNLVHDLKPPAVSIALREIFSDGNQTANRHFFRWASEADIAIQHILYQPAEVGVLADLIARNCIPETGLQLLFVLGRYNADHVSDPGEIVNFLNALRQAHINADWAVCAFGINETKCLVRAFELGGKMRVGFENNMLNADGTIAKDNAERVEKLVAATT